MLGTTKQIPNLNYLPYISSTNYKTKQTIKLLIDSGANKNVIRPGILTNCKETISTTIKNISGNHVINKKGKANLISCDLPAQTYYELYFHDFFDGIIGSEFLAQNKAKINYEGETLDIANVRIPYHKYFPSKKLFSHNIQINTNKNGDWLVPTFQKLYKSIIIEPGLYKSHDNKSTVKILTTNQNIPMIGGKFNLKVNNFETITPIAIEPKDTISREILENIIRTDHLSELEKQSLFETILENQAVLLKPNEKLTTTSAIKHKIITTDEQPVYTKSYRYPHTLKKDVEEQIKELFDNGIIQHSTSPYSSPIWVVPKKRDASGKQKIRVVIDYRKINEKTISDKFPIPQIEEILDNLGKSIYFTTLDLKSGFHQIEMDPDHQHKTAFSTSQGHFEFTRMPFGLKNAPATFQRAMNSILSNYIGNICYVYLDDIIIVGHNLKNHLENVSKVLRRLVQFNLKIQLDKCEFLRRETEFLGHIITPEGIKPNPDKITKILEWPLPKNEKQIRQFLGLSGYYRRFIKNYSKITKPMTKYLKKDQTVDTNDPEFIESFTKLKETIASDQVLAYPDFELPFILTTDASNYAVGAVLSQVQDKVERPIAFASRTLNKAETNYSTIEKEALAIIWAIRKYKPYLYGNKFQLFTDHKPLTFIKTSTKNNRILQWRLELADCQYTPEYKQGKANVVADALSRKTEETPEINFNTDASPNTDEENETQDTDDLETVHSADTSDDYFIKSTERPINYYRNQLIFRVSRLNIEASESPFPNFYRTTVSMTNYDENTITQFIKKYHNGKQTAILAPENLINLIQNSYKNHFNNTGYFVITHFQVEDVTSEERQNFLITKEHERAHRGINEVENQLKRAYFFPRMHKKISAAINTCTICNAHKYERKPYNIKISPRPATRKPMERVHMDIFSINKCNFLSMVDSFSKFAQMIPIDTKNLIDVKNALSRYFGNFGTPLQIVTDHETTFRSIQLKNFLSNLGTALTYASSSESNGQVEKTHSTIIEIYNTNKNKFQDLNTRELIQISISLYNSSIHTGTGFTPNEIIFNQTDQIDPQDISREAEVIFSKARNNIEKSRQIQEKYNFRKENPPVLEEGQEVFIRPNIRKKLDLRAVPTKASNIQEKTFNNVRNIKRHKNKIKRIKKTT